MNSEPYDFSNVIEIGLMDSKSFAFSNNIQDIAVQLKGLAKSETDLVFELYKEQIIKKFKFGVESDDPSPIFKNAVTKEKFNEYFQDFIRSGIYSEKGGIYSFEKLVEHMFRVSLNQYQLDLCICLAPENSRTYCSDIIVDPIGIQSVKKRIDDVYYITKIRLPDEINVLPMPQTLNQAIILFANNISPLSRFRNYLL